MADAPERIYAGPDAVLGWDYITAEHKPWPEMNRTTEYVRAATLAGNKAVMRDSRLSHFITKLRQRAGRSGHGYMDAAECGELADILTELRDSPKQGT